MDVSCSHPELSSLPPGSPSLLHHSISDSHKKTKLAGAEGEMAQWVKAPNHPDDVGSIPGTGKMKGEK